MAVRDLWFHYRSVESLRKLAYNQARLVWEKFVMKREHKGRSLLGFPDVYVVIDIETTGLDPKYDEIIEIGAIKVESGAEVDTFQSLVKPYEPVSGFIENLTGITNDMLKDAPTIDEVLPYFLEFIDDFILVGHNVNFDINFLYDFSLEAKEHHLRNDFVDTMRLARWYLLPELSSHKLEVIARHFSCENLSKAHRALRDCEVTNYCFSQLRYVAIEKYGNLSNFNERPRAKSPVVHSIRSKDILSQKSSFFEKHPFYQKVCVVTGKLEKMARFEAMQHIVDVGGINGDAVTSKTDYLILGCNDYNRSVKDGKSSKQKRAEKLMLEGKDIKIISENVFYDMIAERKENS